MLLHTAPLIHTKWPMSKLLAARALGADINVLPPLLCWILLNLINVITIRALGIIRAYY
jgi:hypothetical protein